MLVCVLFAIIGRRRNRSRDVEKGVNNLLLSICLTDVLVRNGFPLLYDLLFYCSFLEALAKELDLLFLPTNRKPRSRRYVKNPAEVGPIQTFVSSHLQQDESMPLSPKGSGSHPQCLCQDDSFSYENNQISNVKRFIPYSRLTNFL